MERQTMTVEEAAQALGIGRTSAYALCRRGALPALRLGNRLVIPRDRFERWLAGTGGSAGDTRATG